MPAERSKRRRNITRPHLSFDYADRAVHAHDASLYRLLPRAVARPKSENDVIQLIGWAKSHRSSLTFRTGGTSLSGQAVTNETLVLLGSGWDSFETMDNGLSFQCGPALRGGVANAKLARFGRRIGPDPASISAACMGGIVSNNASGMCCGIEENSFRTLIGLRLILASGQIVETHSPTSEEYLRIELPALYKGLLSLRDRVRASPSLCALIRRKSSMKNTMGYALASFLDFENASDILAHLIVGSEGTLGFISQILMRSVPLRPHRATSLMLFDRVEAACSLSSELRNAGCSAIEFLDHNSMSAISHHQGLPSFLRDLKNGNAALLVQIQADTANELDGLLELNFALQQHQTVLRSTGFFSDRMMQEQLWELRKGIFPAVGARRPKGTSVIIEDIAFPQENLASGTLHLQHLLKKYGYHDAVIYGHARDGNLHFVLSQDFSASGEVTRYARFIDAMTQSVAIEFSGSLKAEHGTGRNMAPFVEMEWGSEAYELMREVKRLLDPQGVFNDGVMITSDPHIHLKNLKSIPLTDDEIDSCIECGFCEPVCPSSGFTLSPRGRIVLEREKKFDSKSQDSLSSSEVVYRQIDSCAADGICSKACPVGINTGNWVKKQRSKLCTEFQKKVSKFAANDAPLFEKFARGSLNGMRKVGKAFGNRRVRSLSRTLNKTFGLPYWRAELSGIPTDTRPVNVEFPDFIVFRSCVTRMCGLSQSPEASSSGEDVLLTCAQRAGVSVLTVANSGLCCGQPWDSKGFFEDAEIKTKEVFEVLYQRSDSGRVPVVIDNSPCEHSLRDFVDSPKSSAWLNGRTLDLWDPVDFALYLSGKVELKPLAEPVRFFAVCSVHKTGRNGKFVELARRLAPLAQFPDQEACCGMAGDRGAWIPELVENVNDRLHWGESKSRMGFCTSRTCEVALSSEEGSFHSVFEALERASRPG